MIILSIETHLYRIPPATQWQDATHKVSALEFLTVEIKTEEGYTGLGLTYTVGVGGSAIKSLIDDYCSKILIGQDARDIEKLWNMLYNHLHRTGTGGLNTLAIAGIDVALWDLSSKERKIPLFKNLGGARPKILAYGSGIDLFMTADQFESHLVELINKGYQAIKIKVGKLHLSEDLKRLAIARKIIGPDRMLMLDANQCWRLDEAVRRVKAFEEYNPNWIEEPLLSDDIEGHARLRKTTTIPIAIGESLYTKHQFLDYLKAEAVDILQPDVARVGGITEAIKIAHLAHAWNRPIAPHFLMELSVHLLCGVENGLILENVMGGSLSELGILLSPIRVENGELAPLDIPGHGIQMNWEQLSQYEVHGTQLKEINMQSYINKS